MYTPLRALALAAMLACAGGAQAAALTFNNGSLIDFDFDAGTATYTESGFQIIGRAFESDFGIQDKTAGDASDQALVGGFKDLDGMTMPFTLRAVGGGAFGLRSLQFAFFDLGDAPGALTVSGMLGGLEVASQTLSPLLETYSSVDFGANWLALDAVTFTGSSGFALDNISAVPEPGSLALALAGLVLVGASVRRTQRRTPAAAA